MKTLILIFALVVMIPIATNAASPKYITQTARNSQITKQVKVWKDKYNVLKNLVDVH